MKKLFLLILLSCTISSVLKAQFVNLKISKLKIVLSKKDTLLGNDNQVILKNNRSKQEVELYNNSGLVVKATYKVSTNNGVRRSNLKKSAVNVDENYKFFYNGKKNKVKTKRIFYLDDDKRFEEAQTAVFKEGINNKMIDIMYECILE